MSVKITLEEAVDMQQGLQILSGMSENIEHKNKLTESKNASKMTADEIFELSYQVSKWLRKTKEHVEEYGIQKQKLLKLYATEILDENGNKTNKFSINDEDNYNEGLKKLNKEEVDIPDVRKLSLASLKKFGCGGVVLTSCAPIIKFDIEGLDKNEDSE
jgi:hypothetical protein